MILIIFILGCGHCKKMKPDYAKVADELKKVGASCQLAIFDCTKNPEITEEYEISGFPTLKVFQNGKYVTDYTGNRTPEDLKSFIINFKKKDEL